MGRETPDKVLLVEGETDKYVTIQLATEHRLPEFQVKAGGSLDEALALISVELKSEHIKSLGIVVDADGNIEGRWRQVCDRFKLLGYILPDSPVTDGWVSSEASVKAGAWIMPNNVDIGMLEDFLIPMIDDSDTLLEKAKKTLDEIEELRINRYSQDHRSKALIHTWLAWQKQPGLQLSHAVKAKYLKTDKIETKPFRSWLSRLFSDVS